jgi:hypothetical protein
LFPKDSTAPPKILDESELHSEKQPSGTLWIHPTNSTVVKDKQPLKQYNPIATRKIMDLSEWHALKQKSCTL